MILTKSYVLFLFLHAYYCVINTIKKPRNLLRGLRYIEFVISTYSTG
ncbi:hypothetical protein SAMN04488122_0951 [Chitinophaga arvensicola]|uniref:Uncharacterized protein n=1 Tax=Chitinophaga arvensicola TaxID=29529 RepID=A0A1I0PSC7_9BACT|nr:hypothetical protein SAMN04488122_0951 [Chitinophaga arvensicola]